MEECLVSSLVWTGPEKREGKGDHVWESIRVGGGVITCGGNSTPHI